MARTDRPTLVVETDNGQTVMIVDNGEGFTIRVAKAGHNRAVVQVVGGERGNCPRVHGGTGLTGRR